MRKNKFFNIYFVAVTAVYFVFLLLYAINVYPFSIMHHYWLQTFFIFMASIMLMRAILFRSDSSLLFGLSLLTVGLLLIFKAIFELQFLFILPILVLCISFSTLITYICFKNKLYLKSFIILALITLLLCNLYWII